MKKLTLSLLGLLSIVSTNSFADDMKLYKYQSIINNLEINLAQYNYNNAKSELSIYSIKFFGTTDSGNPCSFTYDINNGLTNKIHPSSTTHELNLNVTLPDGNKDHLATVLNGQFLFNSANPAIGSAQFISNNYEISYRNCSFYTIDQNLRLIRVKSVN
ncbi:MAG: hypothetical protein RLZZ293_1365 [Pseudomonadota bacterium]